MAKYEFTPELIQKILKVLERGDRVELIPCKDGIKAIEESRKEIK